MRDDQLSATASESGVGATGEEIWLLGQPHLRDYLAFVRDMVVGGAEIDPKGLCDEWRRANDRYHDLEELEAGIADRAECRELDPRLAPLAEEVMADSRFRCTFATLPTSFAMVELDKLVICQTHVSHDFVDTLKRRLGPAPDPEALFRFCLPTGPGAAPLRIQRMGSRRYAFVSESTDLRFHEAVLLQAGQIGGYESFGPIGGVVGLVVGFGSNFLNVIRADDRLMLHNGYHRACALRELGVTHAPCLVRTVTRLDELAIAAKSTVAETPAFYFKAARPPLLKDFFDPRIRKALRVRRTKRIVEVSFEIREFTVVE